MIVKHNINLSVYMFGGKKNLSDERMLLGDQLNELFSYCFKYNIMQTD